MSRGTLGRWAAGLTPLAAGVWLLLTNGVAASQVLTYAGYLLLAVLGPGILVARAVLGRAPLLLAELGVGGATGMVLHLAAWSVAVASGLDGWLRWWPVVVYGGFALVPRLRRHWRVQAYPERLTWLVAWTLALSVVMAFTGFSRAFAATVPLTGTNQWPQDLYWHLGLVELFARQVRPEDAQVAGEHLAYHWFAHADIAGASLVTGLDPALVLSRLWVLPVVALTVAGLVAALREVGPHGPRAAAVASVLVAAPAGLEVLDRVDVPWDPVFAPQSPSQNYSYPLMLLTVGLLVRYLRRGELRTLPPLVVLLLLGPGAKVSTLPVLLSGLALATGVAVLRRGSWRRPALLVGLCGAALVVGTVALGGAGGGTGARVQLMASLRRVSAFHESVGMGRVEASLPGGLLPPGLHVPGAWLVLLLLLLATAVKYAWVAPGLPLLRGRAECLDPVPWVLGGGGLAGWLLMLLVDHSGMSQVYFLTTGTVLWAMLSGCGTVALLDRAVSASGGRVTTRWAVLGGLLGIALGFVVTSVATHVASRNLPPAGAPPAVDRPDPQAMALALAAGILPLVGVLLGVLLWVVAGRRRTRGMALRGTAAAIGVVAASVVLNLWLSAPDRPLPPPTRGAVTASELDAARWIAQRAGRHDVVATNVHCLSLRTRPSCDARSFWVSALTRRRTYVGGWAYLDRTRALAGLNGLPPARQPFHDPERFALNQALFEAPTPAVAAELSRRGVVWVYADHRRSPVSPDLATVAELAHRTAHVDVYRLPEVSPTR